MKIVRLISLTAMALTFFALQAFAGISADVTMKFYKDGKQDHLAKGKYFSQDQKVFVEHQAEKSKAKAAKNSKANTETVVAKPEKQPVKQGFILDQKTAQGMVLLHHHKKFMNVDLTQPRSWEQNFWRRFVMQGGVAMNPDDFKKRQMDLTLQKEERLNGHPCKVWKATRSLGGQTEVTQIWTAKDLGDLPIKIVSKMGTETKQEFALSNIKQSQLQASIFSPPTDYTNYQPKIMTGGMPDEMKDKQGGKGMRKGKNSSKPS